VDAIRRFLEARQAEPRDIAILFRTNEQTRAFETELRRFKVPYVLLGGMSFFDRKEVRDVLSYLRVMVSPEDEVSLLRIINTPARGLGAKSVEQLMQRAVAQGITVWQQMLRPQELPPKIREACARFTQLVQEYQSRLQSGPLAATVRDLIDRIDYEGELKRQYPNLQDQQSRWDIVQEVVNAVALYEQRTRKPKLLSFLDDVTLGDRDFDNEKDKQLQRNAVVLMTLHSAKGLEFPIVYMVGMEEGILPHHRSLGDDERGVDEERRLCYVGVTRAQERLTLTFPRTRMKWGRARDTIPSRFLYELTGQADNPQEIARRQEAIRRASRDRQRGGARRNGSHSQPKNPPKKGSTRRSG
jgi:DNA helicase-2/ATP-dependent DNA helicase PcrA